MDNINIVKISGRAEIPSELKLETDYCIALETAECRKVELVPNDDGTYSKIYNLRITNATEVTIGDGKTVVKSTGKGSQSHVQRAILLKLADKLGVDREEYYIKRMSNNIKALQNELIG